MSLKASSLKNNDAQRRAINKEVKGILAQIDHELKTAHEMGKHGVSISVPIIFAVPFMSNTDAQRIIYYKILASLLDREFIVEIHLQQNFSVFDVTWLSEEERGEIDLQNTLLAKHTRK